MSDEDFTTQTAGFSLSERVKEVAPVLKAVLVSLVLHGIFFGIVYLETGFRPPVRMEFEASQGVALLSRSGQSMEIDQRDIENADPMEQRIDELSEPEVDPDDPSVIDEEEEKRLQEERERRQREEERRRQEAERARREAAERQRQEEEAARQRAEEQAEREQEVAEVLDEPETAEGSDETDQPAAEEPDDSSAQEEEAASAPDQSVPPAERYPPGTLNPVATDVGMWGPEGARLVVIMRNDRIRQSPHADSVRRVLSSFPDWKSLLGHADLEPLKDIDTLLIASSDPRYINQTFLAAVHTIPPSRIVEVLEAGFPGRIAWEERNGRLIGDPEWEGVVDPRVFVLPTNNLFILSRPEFIAPLLSDAPAPVGLETARQRAQGGGENTASSAADTDPSGSDAGGDGEESNSAESSSPDEQGNNSDAQSEATEAEEDTDGGSSAEERGEGAAEQELAVDEPDAVEADDDPPVRDDGWMRGILNLADFGGAGDDGPAVIVSTGSISSLSIRGMGDAPAPGSLHASISADADPVVRARLLFEDHAQAGEFVDAWPGILEANATSIRLSGLSRPLSEAEWSIDHNEAILEFTIPERILRRISVTVSRIMDSR